MLRSRRDQGAMCSEGERRRQKEIAAMDLGLLIQLISGLVGGNLAGTQLKEKSLGTLGNSLAGVVGGGLGGQILNAMLGLGAGGAGGLDIGAIISQLAGGGVSGAVLTVIVALLKAKFAK